MTIIQIEIKDSTMPTWTWALNIAVHRLGILVTVRVFYLEFPESTQGGTAGSVLGANQPTSQWQVQRWDRVIGHFLKAKAGSMWKLWGDTELSPGSRSVAGLEPGMLRRESGQVPFGIFLHWFGAEAVMMVIARSGWFCLASARDPAGLFSKNAAWGLEINSSTCPDHT